MYLIVSAYLVGLSTSQRCRVRGHFQVPGVGVGVWLRVVKAPFQETLSVKLVSGTLNPKP